MQNYDQAGQPLIMPVLPATGGLLDGSGEEAGALLSGLSTFEHVQVAALDGVEQAGLLTQII